MSNAQDNKRTKHKNHRYIKPGADIDKGETRYNNPATGNSRDTCNTENWRLEAYRCSAHGELGGTD